MVSDALVLPWFQFTFPTSILPTPQNRGRLILLAPTGPKAPGTQTQKTRSPFSRPSIPPCLTVSGFTSMAVETQILNDTGIFESVIATLLKAIKSAARKIYYCTWKSYFAWYERSLSHPLPEMNLYPAFWPFCKQVLTSIQLSATLKSKFWFYLSFFPKASN